MTQGEKNVIIIGGSYAGFIALKTLLNSSTTKLNITLISPSKFAYFNAAAPRILIQPELLDKVVFSIPESIKKLSQGTIHSAEFYQGSVSNVDLDKRVVFIGETQLNYDSLIITSGSRTKSPVFKLDNIKDEKFTVNTIKKVASDIKKSQSIAVIGGGSTGVETAGEIAYAYHEKDVVLYTGGSGPLSRFSSSSTTSGATSKLNNLGVQIINDQRVTVKGNVVILPNGNTKEYDLVIEALGTLPNTEFLPSKVLNNAGFIETDEYFRLKEYPNVVAAGDAIALGTGSIVNIKFNQEPVFEKTLQYEVVGDNSVKLKAYLKPTSYTTMTPIGKDGGVGLMFGWSVPSFVVKMAKSKDFMIPKAASNFT